MTEFNEEQIASERAFLHDLSNQLVIAQGMGGLAFSELKKILDPDSRELKRLEKANLAMDKLVDMVRQRREYLKKSTR